MADNDNDVRKLIADTQPGGIGVARCADGMVGVVVRGAQAMFIRLEPDAARKMARDLMDAAKTPKTRLKVLRLKAGGAESENGK